MLPRRRGERDTRVAVPMQKSLHLEQGAKSRSLASHSRHDTILEENILNGPFNLHAADAN